jgi:hypothetical protein
MSNVFINGRSVVHQGDGQTQISAAPDVCKTPSPGGPVPVPYVNTAQDSALESGSKSISIEGNSVALANSKLSVSSGDEPGTAGGGIISAKTKGKLSWSSYSIDVKLEGKGAVRFLDTTLHNGNMSNSGSATNGRTGMGYGDDPHDGMDECPKCHRDKTIDHRIDETLQAQGYALELSGMLARYAHGGLRPERLEPNKYNGFMIGALICKCHQKIFAAMSGLYSDAFEPAVLQLAKKNPRWTLCKPLAMGEGARYRTSDRSYFRVSKLPPAPNNSPKPGSCAAPRLIQQALSEDHIAEAMSEIWHCPPSAPVKVFGQTSTTQEYWKDGQLVKDTFGHLESVPSCNTCKMHLTPMVCGADVNHC